MATIPSAEELGLRSPTKVGRGADTRAIRTRGATALDLKSVETTAAQEGLKQISDRIANEELATAEVQFQLGAMAEAEKYKNDPDLDTIEERHAAGMQDQLGKASANITSAKTRALFITRAELGVAKANGNMNEKTTARKNDREKGHMANAMDLMVKGGMDLEYGDPGTAAVGIQLTLDSMVERNVITAVDAQATMKKAQLDMAYGRLKQMDPTQQLAILNSTDPKTQKWLEDVPPDVLRQLKEQAEAAEMNNVAQAYAFETRGDENALNNMYDQAEKEGWDDERTQKTRLRILRIEQDDELMKQKALDDYYEEGAAEIFAGNATLEMMEATPQGIEMLSKLSTAQRNNLVAAQDQAVERAAGRGRKYSDLEVKDELKRLMASGNLIGGRKYWSENYARLNDADFKYFNVATSPTKSSAASFKPLQTTNQLMSDYLDAHPLDEEGERLLWDALSGQAEQFWNENQKNPEPALVRQWVKDKHANIVLDKPTKFLGMEFGGEEVLERDITPEQRRIVKPITNVYEAAGMTGESAIKQFNAMSAPERAEFTRKRLANPGMDPKEFLGKWKRGLDKYRERIKAGIKRNVGRGHSVDEDGSA
jgi:hypothetical protein